MKQNSNKLWMIAIALGWLFDFLFWKKAPGVNFAIFSALCVAAALYLLLSDGKRPPLTTIILIPSIGIFSAVTFIRLEPMTMFLAVVFTLLSMSILAVTYLGGRWMQYSLTDYFRKAVSLLGSMAFRPIMFATEAVKLQKETGAPPARFNAWPVLRGIIIALPVVAVFASLLASADVIFSARLDRFIDLFKLENLPEYIFRLVYILVGAYALSGVFLHAATESSDEKLSSEEKPLVPPFLGFVESSIVLGSVVVLFATFVVIQFQYFFGGNANISVEGYTYSEYAVRGFGELVAVAFFSLLMLLTLSAVTKRETALQKRIYSALGVVLVCLLMVMLFSAYLRLGLYESVYGFSRLRTYTHVFLIWLALLLVATIILEILGKERMFAFAMLAAAAGFAVSLPLLNVDAFIVRQNIQRELHPSKLEKGDYASLDARYFVDLDDDAIPPLVEAFKDESLPADVREKLGASLACIQHERSLDDRERPWQSFHFSVWNADKALAAVQNDLKAYELDASGWPYKVTMPSGEEFECQLSYYYD